MVVRKNKIADDVLAIARKAGAGPEELAEALSKLAAEGVISKNADGSYTVN